MAEPLQKHRDDDGDEPRKSGTPLEISRETHVADRASLERVLYVDPDGRLMQDFSIMVDDILIGGGQWAFKSRGTHDEYIHTLDEHWEQLKQDFTDAVRQGNYYNLLKDTSTDGERSAAFLRGYLHHLQEDLLKQKFDDDDIAHGKTTRKQILKLIKVRKKLEAQQTEAELANTDALSPLEVRKAKPEDEPLTTISDRLSAMRAAAEDNDYTLDRFEEFIFNAESQMERVRRAYYDDGRQEGLQLAGGDTDQEDDFEFEADEEDEGEEKPDPNAWRESIPEVDLGGYDDEEGADESLWEESDDVDDERETEADYAVLKVSAGVERFSYAANQIWTGAAGDIHHNIQVKRNDEQIKLMETFRDETQKAYDEFRAAVDGSSMAQFEYLPVFELFEDPKDGVIANMQKAIDMAKKPFILESVVKKHMTKQRDSGDLPEH